MTLTYFIRSGLPDSKLLSFSCQKESNQRKRHSETCCDFQSQFPRIKRKIGTRELARCFALYRAQTNARYDPIFILMLGCV